MKDNGIVEKDGIGRRALHDTYVTEDGTQDDNDDKSGDHKSESNSRERG